MIPVTTAMIGRWICNVSGPGGLDFCRSASSAPHPELDLLKPWIWLDLFSVFLPTLEYCWPIRVLLAHTPACRHDP